MNVLLVDMFFGVKGKGLGSLAFGSFARLHHGLEGTTGSVTLIYLIVMLLLHVDQGLFSCLLVFFDRLLYSGYTLESIVQFPGGG